MGLLALGISPTLVHHTRYFFMNAIWEDRLHLTAILSVS